MDSDIDSALAELGLPTGASEREVKAAWRRLVSQWHPDRNGSAAAVEKMQRINRAVETLRRAALHPPQAATAAAPGAAPEAPPPQRRPAPPEAPLRTVKRRVKLTLEEAAFGCTKVLRGKLTPACAACEGVGWRVLGGHCPRCRGSGAVHQPSWFGWGGARTECEACHGGGIARAACTACDGSGKAATLHYDVTARLPHGVRDGDVLGVDAHPGRRSAIAVHLSLRVELQPHALFTLDDDGTLRCEVPVDGFAWIANRPVQVPTLDGAHTLQPQRHQLAHRLPGLGFPVSRRGPRGDQWVTLVPVFPPRLSADQQALVDQLIGSTSGGKKGHADERLRAWQRVMQARTAGRTT